MSGSVPQPSLERARRKTRWLPQTQLSYTNTHKKWEDGYHRNCFYFLVDTRVDYLLAFRLENIQPPLDWKKWCRRRRDGQGWEERRVSHFGFFSSPPRARPCRRLCVMYIYTYICVYISLLYWNSYVAAAGVNSAFPITSHDKKWNARLPISPVSHSGDTLYPVWPSWTPLLNTESFFTDVTKKKSVSPLY